MTTVLVQNGTLERGDTLLVGEHYGRIRFMFDFRGKGVKKAEPSMPVSVAGLNGIPQAGEQFRVVESEKEARKLIAEEEERQRWAADETTRAASLDDFFTRLQGGETKTLNLVVKADVQGSLEPIVNSLEKLSTDEVAVEVLHAATGNISESDVMLAAASDAVILGFNVSVDSIARAAASSEQVDINTYSIIYKLVEDVENAIKGLFEPTYEDVLIGRAEVRQVFRIGGVGNVAGCYMRTGEARRNSKARLIRDNTLLHTGPVSSLKHLQENVREIKAGFEFGVNIRGWDDYQAGDILEFFVTQRVEEG
jgi:translation initiation factor IF-2